MNQLRSTLWLKETIPSSLDVQNFLVNKFSTTLVLAIAAVAAAVFGLIIFISRKNFLMQTIDTPSSIDNTVDLKAKNQLINKTPPTPSKQYSSSFLQPSDPKTSHIHNPLPLTPPKTPSTYSHSSQVNNIKPVSEEEKMKNVKNFITLGMTDEQIEETMGYTVKIVQIQQWRLETEQVLNNPIIVVASGNLNQYQVGGPAACTSLACSFLHSKTPTSSGLIVDLLNNNTYTENHFAQTEEMLKKYDLKKPKAPLPIQKGLPFIMMSFQKTGDKNLIGIEQTLPVLLEDNEIAGAIITGNGLTLAMRKWGNRVEFFDSHGDSLLTHQGNAAYVISFLTSQRGQMVDFLTKRYPQIGFNPYANIQPAYISVIPIVW